MDAEQAPKLSLAEPDETHLDTAGESIRAVAALATSYAVKALSDLTLRQAWPQPNR
jgi:hypothetical protein